jgi:hypothetical protein
MKGDNKRTLAFVVWLYTVRTWAIDFLTTPIFDSFDAAPFVTLATRSCLDDNKNTINEWK